MKLEKAYEPSPEVLAALAKPVERNDSRNAELLPDVSPKWYVIEVWPGAERKVVDELVSRRFGIYVPGQDITVVRRGRKFDLVEMLFPGYIFVFVCDLVLHRDRIEAIDGVIRVIMDVNGAPLFLPDDEIDRVRVIENLLRPVCLELFAVDVEPAKKKNRRKQRRAPKAISDEIVRTRVFGWSRSDFDDTLISLDDAAMSLDSPGGNQTFLRALGLCL